MDIVTSIISDYGFTILYAIGTAIFGALGLLAKNIYTKYANTKTKKQVVDTAIKAVEQIYTNLHGEDKLKKAMQGATEMLAENGITISELELTMLIEASLAELNDKFKEGKTEKPSITPADVKNVIAETVGGESDE